MKELKENGCESCPIKLNFESTILHSITCESCGEKVLKEEACHDFSLVIPDSDENTNPDIKTIEGLLSMYFDCEMIEYTCEKCEGSLSIFQTIYINKSSLATGLVVPVVPYSSKDS